MKKLKYILFLIPFLVLNVNAEVINGTASIASGVIYTGSYGFTPNITLDNYSENVYRYSTDYNDPFIMGTRYVAAVNLGSTGANSFSGVVQIPVAIYSLNNVTLYNRVTSSNFHVGISNNFYEWNLTPDVKNFTSNCSVYYNLNTNSPYNICVYTINFTATSNNMIYGGTNLSFALYDWSNTSNLVFQPLGGSWGNNGGGWIFPRNPTNIEGASNIAPTYILSYGNNVSETLLQQQIQQQQTIINQNQTIINQQNQNTQSIITNQDSNTQDIIDNQNSNTQQEIESQKVCKSFSYGNDIAKSNGYLTSTGSISNTAGWYHTSNYIPVVKNYTYNLTFTNYAPSSPSYCLYNSSKTLVSCSQYQNRSSIDIVPTVDGFIRYSLNTSGSNVTTFSGQVCSNGNQALNDSLNDLNSSINDTTSPDTTNEISSLQEELISTTPISDLVSLPITLLNSFLTGFNGTCSPYTLGTLYGTSLVLPCINIESIVGSSFWSIIDGLFSIFMIYNLGMLFISVFDGITSLRDDYESLYIAKHVDNGYQPKHGG